MRVISEARCSAIPIDWRSMKYFFLFSNSLEIADCICKYYYFNTCVSPLFTIPVLQSSNFIKCSRNFGFTGQCFESSFLPSCRKVFEFAARKFNFFYKIGFVLQRFLYSWMAIQKWCSHFGASTFGCVETKVLLRGALTFLPETAVKH